ncbi:MAG: P-loop NTPase [Halanaerobiaceae bacterium]
MGESAGLNSNQCKAGSEKNIKEDFLEDTHEMSNIKKVIAIISGKGGVGKSLITSMMAVTMNRRSHETAILDADVTGPSIPKAFGIEEKARGSQFGILPVKSETGINIMSLNLLLENETDPVIWRGPVISGTVKQFWTDVIWGDVDFMFVDMPPGTGDVSLTVFQSIPVDGIIIVTSPQDLVSMIVSKSVNMAEKMNIPILGLVENMAYFKCPDCGKEHRIFGKSHVEEIAQKHNLDVLASLPIDPVIPELSDQGLIERYENDPLENLAKILENMEG